MEQPDRPTKSLSELSTNECTISNDSDHGGIGGVSISPSAPHTPYPKVVTLDVGGRKYKTYTATLRAESGFFRCQLSDRFTWERENDGSYFLDADPDLFKHLLCFMRRPNVFPLFYTKAAGFDFDLYNRLEMEAEYFQIDALQAWIKEKKYLNAIVTNLGKPDICSLNNFNPRTFGPTESQETYVVPRTRKVYICPRDNFVHRGDENKCGVACKKFRGDGEKKYEEETYVEVVSARNETVFREGACRLE